MIDGHLKRDISPAQGPNGTGDSNRTAIPQHNIHTPMHIYLENKHCTFSINANLKLPQGTKNNTGHTTSSYRIINEYSKHSIHDMN